MFPGTPPRCHQNQAVGHVFAIQSLQWRPTLMRFKPYKGPGALDNFHFETEWWWFRRNDPIWLILCQRGWNHQQGSYFQEKTTRLYIYCFCLLIWARLCWLDSFIDYVFEQARWLFGLYSVFLAWRLEPVFWTNADLWGGIMGKLLDMLAFPGL